MGRIGAVEIKLLGGFEARGVDGTRLAFATRKAEALVSLLAFRPGEAFERDKLCGLLWPEVPDTQARHSLRQTLFCVRKAFQEVSAPVLRSDPRRLSLDPQFVQVDIASIERGIRLNTRAGLAEAASLWRGELLEGLSISEQPFQHWLTFERERLRRVMVQALTRLADCDTQAGDFEAAIQACAQLLQLDPWREETHRTLMHLHVRQGRRSSALSHYTALERSLRSDLGAQPEPETRALFAKLTRESGASGVLENRPPVPALSAPLTIATASAAAPVAVGRMLELAALHASRAGAQPAEARVTLLIGEAGIGKTHVCDRFASDLQASGVRVLRARCFESELVLPFSLWANLLTSIRELDDPTLLQEVPQALRPELNALIPEFAEDLRRVAPDVLRLFRAVQALVSGFARRGPVLLILEDLHWADDMSIRLLCFLSRNASAAQPYAILATARQEELERSPLMAAVGELERESSLQRISLAPLSRAESSDLVLQLASRMQLPAPSGPWFERVWSISEGNPLVIVEAARALAQGSLAHDIADMPVPERVRALIERRVSRVSPAARGLLSFAAVAGRELELGVLSHSHIEPEALLGALEELIDSQFLRTRGERVYFTHDRMRETLYAGLLPPRRRWLHARVAAALEQFRGGNLDAELGHIGYHYSKAGDAERAVSYLVRFAEKAMRGHGVRDALSALEQALVDSALLAPAVRVPEAIRIVTRQATCLAFLGRFAELVERLSQHAESLERLHDPGLAAPFHFWWGFSLTVTGDRREAELHGERALAEATRAADSRMIGYARGLLAYLCAVTGRPEQGVEHGEIATRLLSVGDDLPEALVLAWLNFGLNKLVIGEWEGALDAGQRAFAVADAADSDRGRSLAYSHIGAVHAYVQHWDQALDFAQKSLETSKEPFTLVMSLFLLGWAQAGSGQTQAASSVLQQLVDQLELHGMRGFALQARVRLAETRLQSGEPRDAARLARESLVLAREAEDRPGMAHALRVQGQAAQALGDLERARALLDEALHLNRNCERRLDLASTLEVSAELALLMADRALAHRQLRQAHELNKACNAQRALARVEARIAQL